MNMGYRRSRLGFGVELSEDCWRLLKRLYDLDALVEFEVRIDGGDPVLMRATSFDLRGTSSAGFSSEREVLEQLAARAPGLRIQRYESGGIRVIAEIFPHVAVQPPPQPLPPPTSFAQQPVNAVQVAPPSKKPAARKGAGRGGVSTKRANAVV